MTETQKEKSDETEAERRFQDTLTRMVNTPHKPHAPLKPKRDRKS